MYISLKEIDRLVREGGEVAINYWAYDLVAGRLEKSGFRRRSGVECKGPLTFDGSIYVNERGDHVVVTTHRTVGPVTIVKSTPASSKEAPDPG
jgi:hypothetical protein